MPRITGTATLGAANDAATVSGLDSTTAALNVSFEASWDGGTTWDAIAATRIDDAVAGDEAVAITVGNGQTWRYKADLAGAWGIRARCSAYTSGSCAARVNCT